MPNADTPARRKIVLIVEDDMLAAITLEAELQDAGYDVMDLVVRHQEALAAAAKLKPDLALVNIELQGNDDGIALARDLKTLGIPVLFISGQVSRARSANTVAIGSLPKPYSPATMVLAVAYLLRHLEGDDGLPRPAALEVFTTSAQGFASGQSAASVSPGGG